MNPMTCEHCGGVNQFDVGPPFRCRFCAAPMATPALGEGRIWLTDATVLDLLRERLAGVDSTFVHPSIPPKKLANAQKTHAVHLTPDEAVLALYDGTAFGSANDGMIVTSKRLLWHNQMESPAFLEWRHVDPFEVSTEDNLLVVGRAKIDTLFGEDDAGLYAWMDVIETLGRTARPPSKVEREIEARGAQGADPAWGGPEVAVGGATARGAWGGLASGPSSAPQYAWQAVTAGYGHHTPQPEVEPLAAAPYPDGDSCSLVDVHPSGELVLAAGSSTVELRYAANGQRFQAFAAPDTVLGARFSADGNWLLCGCTDRRAYVYEVRTAQRRGATEKMADYCEEVVWLGPSAFAAASQQGEVWIVDARSMQVTHKLLRPSSDYETLGGLAAAPDGSRLFVSVGSRLGCFDVATGRILWRLDEALVNASKLSVSPRGDALVAAGYDGVAFFDAQTGQPGARLSFACARGLSWPEGSGGLLKKLKKDDGMHWSWSPRPRFSPSGDPVAVQDQVGNLCFVDVHTATLYPTPRERGRAFIEDLAWFGDSNHLLLGMSDNSIAIWQARPLVGKLHTRAIDELPPEAYAGQPRDSDDDDDDDDDD